MLPTVQAGVLVVVTLALLGHVSAIRNVVVTVGTAAVSPGLSVTLAGLAVCCRVVPTIWLLSTTTVTVCAPLAAAVCVVLGLAVYPSACVQ